jgi:hypothetical protein
VINLIPYLHFSDLKWNRYEFAKFLLFSGILSNWNYFSNLHSCQLQRLTGGPVPGQMPGWKLTGSTGHPTSHITSPAVTYLGDGERRRCCNRATGDSTKQVFDAENFCEPNGGGVVTYWSPKCHQRQAPTAVYDGGLRHRATDA